MLYARAVTGALRPQGSDAVRREVVGLVNAAPFLFAALAGWCCECAACCFLFV